MGSIWHLMDNKCFDRAISDWLLRLGASPVTPGTTRPCELHPIKRRMLAATDAI